MAVTCFLDHESESDWIMAEFKEFVIMAVTVIQVIKVTVTSLWNAGPYTKYLTHFLQGCWNACPQAEAAFI